MTGSEENLIDNVKEFLKGGGKSKKDKAYNSSVTLYFKAMAVIIDLFILRKEKFIPSNHSERFRLLENKYPLLYKLLDKNFPIYQQSYRLKLTKEYVEAIEDDLKKILEFTKIKVDY